MSSGMGGGVPANWTKAIIVPVYKGKDRRGECGSYTGISLLTIPGKVYGKVTKERVQRLTEEKISEQGDFRKGRGCVDQIFSFRMVVEKILAKGKKLYAAFMDLEKAYDSQSADIVGSFKVIWCGRETA